MNTLLCLGLSMCVFVAYATALPYPSDEVPKNKLKGESLVAINAKPEEESLVPAESAWRGGGRWGGGTYWGGGGLWGGGGGWERDRRLEREWYRWRIG